MWNRSYLHMTILSDSLLPYAAILVLVEYFPKVFHQHPSLFACYSKLSWHLLWVERGQGTGQSWLIRKKKGQCLSIVGLLSSQLLLRGKEACFKVDITRRCWDTHNAGDAPVLHLLDWPIDSVSQL